MSASASRSTGGRFGRAWTAGTPLPPQGPPDVAPPLAGAGGAAPETRSTYSVMIRRSSWFIDSSLSLFGDRSVPRRSWPAERWPGVRRLSSRATDAARQPQPSPLDHRAPVLDEAHARRPRPLARRIVQHAKLEPDAPRAEAARLVDHG